MSSTAHPRVTPSITHATALALVAAARAATAELKI